MKKSIVAASAAMLFVAGIGVGVAAKKIVATDTAMYHGQAPHAASKVLLDAALSQSEGGSWERIAIGRVQYLSGHKAEGQAVFDQVLAGKPEASDIFRVARVYADAGDWAHAKPLFERFLAIGDVDEKEYAVIGAYHLLNGDRATAESMFDRAVEREPRSTWATLAMAAAYAGVKPQE